MLLFVLLASVQVVYAGVNNLQDLQRYAHQNVTFNWTATVGTTILEAKWGLFSVSKNSILTSFITVTPNKVTPNLDSSSRYKGRVHFVGNLTQRRAWFMITNLEVNDANDYAVRITEGDFSFSNYPVKLKVSVPPTTTVPQTTTSTNTTATVPSSNETSNGTDKLKKPTATPTTTTNKTSALGTGEIVGIVIGVLVVIAIIVGVVVWYVKKKKDKKKGLRIPMS